MALSDHKWDVEGCVRCSMCKWVNPWDVKSLRFSKICPASARYLFDCYSAQGKMDIAKGIIDKRLKYENTEKLTEIVYMCTMCGACDVMCKRSRDLELLTTFEELRAKLVEDGQGPMPAHNELVKNMENYDNPWGLPRNRRGRWARNLDVKDITKEPAPVLYFAGCNSSYIPELIPMAENAVAVFKAAGVDFGILGNKEVCCGSTCFRMGVRSVAESVAHRNIEQWNQLGVETVVTTCAGCYSTLKVDYARIGKPEFRVLHVVEFLDELIREGKLKLERPLDLTVTWHDPCHLGRLSEPYVHWEGERDNIGRYFPPRTFRRGSGGQYDPPRRILEALPGVTLIEMERIKEYSWCCGSGGGVRTAFPEFAAWTADERVEEAKTTGAQALVTSCPWCQQNLGEAVDRVGEGMQMIDLLDLVRRSLPEEF